MKRIILAIALSAALILSGCANTELNLKLGEDVLKISFERTTDGYQCQYESPLSECFEPDSIPTDVCRVENAYLLGETAFLTVNAYGACDVYVYNIEKGEGRWLSGEQLVPGEGVDSVRTDPAFMKNYILRADKTTALLRRSVADGEIFEGEYYMIDLETCETCFISKSYAAEWITTARVESFRYAPGEFSKGTYYIQVWNSDNSDYLRCELTDDGFKVEQIDEKLFAALPYVD